MVQVDAGNADGGQHWLLIEWPEGEKAPTHYTLARMRKTPSRKQLVRITKERWRTERVYEDLKGELGLDHYEGRSFRGWHHHVTVVLCCYAFVLERALAAFSPLARKGASSLLARKRGMSDTSRTPSSPPGSPSLASSFDGSLGARAAITRTPHHAARSDSGSSASLD